MKIKKPATFSKKNLKKKLKNKKYCKIRDYPPYSRDYKEAGHSICNLKCNVP